MRFSLRMTLVVLAAIGVLAGCTRSEEKPATATPSETAPAGSPVADAVVPTEPEVEPGDDILMVWAEAEPEEGSPPLKVQLKADISGGSGERKVKWDFGDGSPASAEVNPTHTYEKP